jgi:protein-arginine kinase activator protein McsA
MNVDRFFPCKTCGHIAERHYTSAGDGNFPLKHVCLTCADGGRSSWTEVNEHLHEFIGDNLKYMELKNKKKEILGE